MRRHLISSLLVMNAHTQRKRTYALESPVSQQLVSGLSNLFVGKFEKYLQRVAELSTMVAVKRNRSNM